MQTETISIPCADNKTTKPRCTADIRNPLRPCKHCEDLAAETIRKLVGQADIARDELRADGFQSREQKSIVEEMEQKFLSLGE